MSEEKQLIPETFISILNVCMDYYMSDPTPLSKKEFKQCLDKSSNNLLQGDIQVPVVRMFGPILRGDNIEPLQNGCVHIHNAFPYLVCRPSFAGMDDSHIYTESIRENHSGNDDVSHYIDWNNVDSVESILDIVERDLELALSTFDANKGKVNCSELVKPEGVRVKYIRDISVVKGRGFYGYCNGSPCPFLKIRYYHPKYRWKVKAVIESGVICGGIKFRCFEAHIPYTMQLLKDWRVAGFEYVKFDSGVKFRTPLPHTLTKDIDVMNDQKLFHQENVPSDLLWSDDLDDLCKEETSSMKGYTQQSNDGNNSLSHGLTQKELEEVDFILSQESISSSTSKQYDRTESFEAPAKIAASLSRRWTKKMTPIYKVEFDTTVESIVNTAESDLVERGNRNVHWLAVPSLKDMWEEERYRMSTLLHPKDDFLSSHSFFSSNIGPGSPISLSADECKVPSFTLTRPKGATPNSKDALSGVSKLYGSNELEDFHHNAMRKIMERHSSHIEYTDKQLQLKYGNILSFDSSINDEDGDNDSMIEALDCLGAQFPPSLANSPPCTQESLISTESNTVSSPFLSNEEFNNFLEYTQTAIAFGNEVDEMDFSDQIDPATLTPFDENEESEFQEDTEDDIVQDVNVLKEKQSQWDTQDNRAEHFQTYLDYESEEEDNVDLYKVEKQHTNTELKEDYDLKKHSGGRSQLLQYTKMKSGCFYEPAYPAPSNDKIQKWLCRKGTKRRFKNIPKEITKQTKLQPVSFQNVTDKNDLGGNFGSQVVEEVQWPSQNNLSTSPQSYFKLSQSTPKSDDHSTQSINRKNSPLSCMKSFLERENTESTSRVLKACNGSSLIFTEQASESDEATLNDPLRGIGNQGGRIHIEGGGFKPNIQEMIETRIPSKPQSSLTIMSIEIHVQCRQGRGSIGSLSKDIAMTPDSSRDAVFAVVYIFAKDPGGGRSIHIIDEGCIYVSLDAELARRKGYGVEGSAQIRTRLPSHISIEEVTNERRLLQRIASIVQMKDPDILLSWDTLGAGLGYLIERGVAIGHSQNGQQEPPHHNNAGIDMVRLFGRTPSFKSSEQEKTCGIDEERSLFQGSGLGQEWDDRVGPGAAASSITGRITICGWKISGEEINHPNVSYLPAVVANILKQRLPYHDNLVLSRWYGSEDGRDRWRVLSYRLRQARATLSIIDSLDIIGRTGEAARLSGVEFSQSLPGIRGSQYKVEGVLLRALQSVWANERGKKSGTIESTTSSQSQSPWKLRRNLCHDKRNLPDQGYFFLSPSKEDCNNIEALECQALTLEPESGFHFDPVVVCDFTALYPSLVIAYNLCFSTCAGKLDYRSVNSGEGRTTGRLGPLQYDEYQSATVFKHHMPSLSSLPKSDKKKDDRAYVIPTGAIFVSEHVLKGVIPQVLDEMLATRAMLKRAAKEYRKKVPNISPSILRQLEARQLALKYVANVTYGYTSATFSGRSPMPILADAIVECGRRTLRNAIKLAEDWGKDGGRWSGASVIYGDTDSLFIKLRGRSVAEAFAFGHEFCKAVSDTSPNPVELKLEKVYYPAMLQTKKKYCGMKYESASDTKPVFEGKGIETIRRDQCSLTQKILRNSLITLFRSDEMALKSYLFRQWSRIHAGQLPVSDFILTGRVRSKYRGSGPVQAALARRLAESDPGRSVRHKERQPYVIVASPGKQFKLKDCVLTPMELLEHWDAYTIHATYYSVKHVNAALQRCLGLHPFRIDVNGWYESCPKPSKRIRHWPINRTEGNTAHISYYCISDICALCGAKCKVKGNARVSICSKCRHDEQSAATFALKQYSAAQIRSTIAANKCSQCNACPENASTFAIEKILPSKRSSGVKIPLANCTCIDCPTTYERHRARERGIESLALCKALNLF